jgi:hypothetical protein
MYRLKVTQYCNLAGMKPVTASRTGVITHTIETNFIPTVGSTFSTGNVGGESKLFIIQWTISHGKHHSRSQCSGVRCPRSDPRPAPARDGQPLCLFHALSAQLVLSD